MPTYRKITDLEPITTTNDSDLFIVETASGTRSTSAGNFKTGLGLGNYLLKTEASTTYLTQTSAASTYATQIQLAGKQNVLTAGDGITIVGNTINAVAPTARTPIISMTETTYTIEPNKYYQWGTVASLNITLGGGTGGSYLDEYVFEFTSGSTPTIITVSPAILWTKTFIPQANTKYQCSIASGIGVWIGADTV